MDALPQDGVLARTMLVEAAAQRWNVPVADCTVAKGVVYHDASHRRATYGELADAASQLKPPADVSLKPAKEFTLIGKPTLRIDTPSKINGTAQFGLDVHLPGTSTAVVARPPVFGGKVIKFDAGEALKVRGVKAVEQVPTGVAVIADGFWPAKLGRDKLHIDRDLGPNANLTSEEMFREFAETSKKPGLVARKVGDPQAALAGAAKTIAAEYDVPYLAHCMMEPLNRVVDLRADSCEIWTGTQFQTGDCAAAAKIAGLPFDKVRVHTTFLGGGFGRRANPASDFVSEAVDVAKVAKAPVKVVWTREDDLKGGRYRPMWHDRFAAGLDAAGNPVAWTHTIVGQSIFEGTGFASFGIKNGIDAASVEGAADILYGIPICKSICTPRKSACPCSGGARWATRTRAFQSKLSSMKSRTPAAKIPTNCAALCSPPSRACWPFSISPRRKPIGAASCRTESAAASPAISPSTAMWRK